MRPFIRESTVIAQERINPTTFCITLKIPPVMARAAAGTFVHVKINAANDPLLRRPLSIYQAQKLSIKLLYDVKGRGTTLLSQKARGETVNLLGPLGNGFSIAKKADRHILVAGGIGVAPLMMLAQQLRKNKQNVTVLIGALTQSKLLCEKEFKKLGCAVLVATDDGSKGFRGRVTELFQKKILSVGSGEKNAVYACGPYPMLAQCACLCTAHHLPLQVSLEEFMGCGIGACLGCVIKTKTGYQRICHDGPVFDANTIIWK